MMHSNWLQVELKGLLGRPRCEGVAWSNRNRQGRKEDGMKEKTKSKATKTQIWKVQQLLN